MTSLEELNNAPREEAFAALLACCGAPRWAQRMVMARPFADVAALLAEAESIWWELRPDDWLEAFASHPRIGERQAQPSTQAAQWSEAEQAGTRNAADETRLALRVANRAYEERFGYIFIVCATGKNTAEMLAACRARLDNDPETELRTAADEQWKITEIRLRKLIGAAA